MEYVAEGWRPAIESADGDIDDEERERTHEPAGLEHAEEAHAVHGIGEGSEGTALRVDPRIDGGGIAAHGLRYLRDEHSHEAAGRERADEQDGESYGGQ
jgi:hypothetical protein